MSATIAPDSGQIKAAATSASPTARLAAVDGLRACAILMVYLYHAWLFSDCPPLRGMGRVFLDLRAGVDLFMVLSGFCLFWPIARKPAAPWDLREYARRRVRRIMPPYYASIVYVTLLPVVLVAVSRLLGTSLNWQPLPTLRQYLTHLTFTHTLSPHTWDGIQGGYWSLGLEVQFYLVFPLVVFGFRRMGPLVVVPMILLSVAYRVAVQALLPPQESYVPGFLLSVTFLGRWMEFAAGMLAAWMVARRAGRPVAATRGNLLLIASAIAYYLATLNLDERLGSLPARDLLFSTSFAVATFALCAGPTVLSGLLEHRALVFLGLISYSVFLVHQNTAMYLGEFLRRSLPSGAPARLAIMSTAGLVLITGISWVFFLLVERRFVNAPSSAKRPTLETVQHAEPAPATQVPVLTSPEAAFAPSAPAA